MKKTLGVFTLIGLLLLQSPGIAQNNDWARRQQEEQRRQQAADQQRQRQEEARRQQDEQRRQQQAAMREALQRQQQEEIKRQQAAMREEARKQAEDLRRRQQADLKESQRQQQASLTKANQEEQRRQLSQAQKAQAAGKPTPSGTNPAIANKASDRMVFSNGVAKLTRPLTAAEMKRGFTGKVTDDGRALVKFQNRIFAVPASRIGITAKKTETSQAALATGWSAEKRAALNSEVQKLAGPSSASRTGISGAFNSAAIRPGNTDKLYSPQIQSRIDAAKSIRDYANVTSATAIDELKKLPKLNNMQQSDISSMLHQHGYKSVPAHSGGTVWTKSLPDGNTAVVRLDPPNKKSPNSYADSVEHAHKEIVPSELVKEGNYSPGPHVQRFDDQCTVSNCPRALHIPTKPAAKQ